VRVLSLPKKVLKQIQKELDEGQYQTTIFNQLQTLGFLLFFFFHEHFLFLKKKINSFDQLGKNWNKNTL
jgi:hypothetical protein